MHLRIRADEGAPAQDDLEDQLHVPLSSPPPEYQYQELEVSGLNLASNCDDRADHHGALWLCREHFDL